MKPEKAFVALDLVLVGIRAATPHVALINRPPESGIVGWGLPGAFIGQGEVLTDTTQRVLKTKVGFAAPVRLRPLTVADDPSRDPRGRVISLPHLALTSELPDLAEGATWARAGRVKDGWRLRNGTQRVELAVDHDAMVDEALGALDAMLDHTDPQPQPAAELLPPRFAVRQLLEVYEAFRDPEQHPIPYDVNAFRRRIGRSLDVRVTDELEQLGDGQAHRPGRLLEFRGSQQSN